MISPFFCRWLGDHSGVTHDVPRKVLAAFELGGVHLSEQELVVPFLVGLVDVHGRRQRLGMGNLEALLHGGPLQRDLVPVRLAHLLPRLDDRVKVWIIHHNLRFPFLDLLLLGLLLLLDQTLSAEVNAGEEVRILFQYRGRGHDSLEWHNVALVVVPHEGPVKLVLDPGLLELFDPGLGGPFGVSVILPWVLWRRENELWPMIHLLLVHLLLL
mmetsp:Transcript_2590/g.7118  ORF Transcript_2590/g.7118 Transcript_2590/m.7118 type:complete len:213 (-) Transcript_2590:736-1374(-)